MKNFRLKQEDKRTKEKDVGKNQTNIYIYCTVMLERTRQTFISMAQ